jgi:hypothetical protein
MVEAKGIEAHGAKVIFNDITSWLNFIKSTT